MKTLAKRLFRSFGFDVVRHTRDNTPTQADAFAGLDDLSSAQLEVLRRARPYTMTSPERMATLLQATNYLVDAGIGGDIAECGVWRGGSMMIVALTLLARGDTSRTLHLYDTFEGMPPPTGNDRAFSGEDASALLATEPRNTGIWCYASLEDVQANLWSTGYPREKIRFIKGKVEQTIPVHLPGSLGLLRLDTDWYESTRHELQHLYPLLRASGILVIDDYGHWQGARKAVDEFLATLPARPYLHRIDYTGRLAVKAP